MFFTDIGLALMVAVALYWTLLGHSNPRGGWRRAWGLGSLIFLCAWAGGAWIAPIRASGWTTYWLPFVATGTIAALLIAIASPTQGWAAEPSRSDLDGDPTAEVAAVTVSLYTLVGGLVVLVLAAYMI